MSSKMIKLIDLTNMGWCEVSYVWMETLSCLSGRLHEPLVIWRILVYTMCLNAFVHWSGKISSPFKFKPSGWWAWYINFWAADGFVELHLDVVQYVQWLPEHETEKFCIHWLDKVHDCMSILEIGLWDFCVWNPRLAFGIAGDCWVLCSWCMRYLTNAHRL